MRVTARMTALGAQNWAGQMAKRGKNDQMARNVTRPWLRDVDDRIRKMYLARGHVSGPGGQSSWASNTASTLLGKHEQRPMLSDKGFRFGSMVRRYRVTPKREALRAYSFHLENTARAASGFDYPSYLHDPGKSGRFTVRPKRPGGLLVFLQGGKAVFAKKTRPSYPKSRPHILFFGIDAENWTRRGAAWVLDGRRAKR